MKKFLAVALVVMMILSTVVLSSCGKSESAMGDDVKNLSYWVPFSSTRAQTYNDILMYQQREKDSGVHIDFIHPASGTEAEQFNLLISSGDLPDMIEYDWSLYPGGPEKAIEDGIIIPIDDYLDKAPNFKKALESGGLAKTYSKGSTTDTGKHFGFTSLNIGDYRVFNGPCIRKDLLKKAGLSVPETIDEWTTALRKFKEMGIPSPLSGQLDYLCYTDHSNFVGAFGIGNRWYIDGNTIKYGPMQDEYKEFLTLLKMWYDEGLIDKDIATNESSLVDYKMLNNETAALPILYIGSGLGKYLPKMEQEHPDWDLVSTPYPVKNKGDINEFPTMEQDTVSMRTIAITSKCKNIEAAVKWCDFWYSDAGKMLTTFGVEGDTYTMVDGKPTYTDKILHNPEGMSVNEAMNFNFRAASACPGFNQVPEYLEQYYQYDKQKEAFKMWQENTEPGRKHLIQNLNPTMDETDTVASIKADLDTYVDEHIWNFVTGKESLDDYDSFRDTIKTKFRFDEYQKIMQAQLDRYNKK